MTTTFGGWYPCCCPIRGSTLPGSSPPPPGSSLPGSSIDLGMFGQIGSSGQVACPCCTDGIAPLQLQVEALGIVIGDESPCSQCEDLNGTYILTWLPPAEHGNFCLPENVECAWGLTFGTLCGRDKAQLYMTCQPAPPSVSVVFSVEPLECGDPIDGALVWSKTFTAVTQIDCAFDGLELTAPGDAPALSCKLDSSPLATVFGL